MPQPAELDDLRDELVALYRSAQADIERRLAAIVSDPNVLTSRARLVRRLDELARETARTAKTLDAHARQWFATRFPEAYQLGADEAAADLGEPFEWAQADLDAVTELARDGYNDLLDATRHMRADAKRLVREAARRAARVALLEGETAKVAGRRMASDLHTRGIRAVRYRNGARHSIDDYAAMVVRTKTAEAHSTGLVNASVARGVEWFQCLDGPDCGLTSHADAEKVNGRVFPASVAMTHRIAHPNCARSWAPRPDLGSASEAEAARQFSPAEQQAAAETERRRATAAVRSRSASRRRSERSRARAALRRSRRAASGRAT